ncbi:MAG: lasso peptide isopeptide bond-forming cyclase [Xenococcaceae cyanobacterium MO_188.B19]|nr:lasso peptide isopeptide bond-forming cyclase [Xenococcaceae cyanobacterium MO_188.B19]
MSAITGIYYFDERLVETQLLNTMGETLAHRGSDDHNIWLESSIGLGHRMLWTTPESLLEKLPCVSRDGKLVITADARIDNREELISLLNLENLPQDKITDSQLILASYEKWGQSCVDNLVGDFAFAIWDKTQQLLFCARDHFGVKPFYYYHSEQLLVFASEIKGLFCLSEVPRKLNEVKVGDFLASTLYDKESTYYQDIFRLPPAHTMTVSPEGITVKSYWNLDPEYRLELSSDEEYAAKFREIFTESVRCRLRSVYPIGSMLSGGLDSSSITCSAQKILSENKSSQQNLHTFSFVFNKVPESDESSFINSVVSQTEVKPNYINGDEISPLIDIEKIIWHQDEPFFAPNLYLDWKAYEIVNQLGVRIILDGLDGDTTVSHGTGYVRELAREGQWLKLMLEIRGYTRNFRGYSQEFNTSAWIKFWFYLEYYGIQPFMSKFRITRFIWYRYKNLETKIKSRLNKDKPVISWSSIFNSQFLEQIGIRKRLKIFLKERYGSGTTEQHEHYQAIKNGILPTTLEVLDKTAAGFGVELRYPFWDKRLVEFCLSLPAEQKMRLGWTRMILRRGMEGILPKEIQWRGGKGNLGSAFEYGLQTFEKDNLEEMLKHPKLIENYINMSYLKKTYEDFISETSKTNDVMSIWKSINLFLWLKYNNMSS